MVRSARCLRFPLESRQRIKLLHGEIGDSPLRPCIDDDGRIAITALASCAARSRPGVRGALTLKFERHHAPHSRAPSSPRRCGAFRRRLRSEPKLHGCAFARRDAQALLLAAPAQHLVVEHASGCVTR
jgi:hypothetical protein